jgi:hypothetical protein
MFMVNLEFQQMELAEMGCQHFYRPNTKSVRSFASLLNALIDS